MSHARKMVLFPCTSYYIINTLSPSEYGTILLLVLVFTISFTLFGAPLRYSVLAVGFHEICIARYYGLGERLTHKGNET